LAAISSRCWASPLTFVFPELGLPQPFVLDRLQPFPLIPPVIGVQEGHHQGRRAHADDDDPRCAQGFDDGVDDAQFFAQRGLLS